MDAIQFSATADGSVKAERVIAGVVVDRFICKPGAAKIKIKVKSQLWMIGALAMLEAPSVDIVIQVPPIPLLEPTQAQQFETVKQQFEEALRHAEHFAQLIEEKQISG